MAKYMVLYNSSVTASEVMAASSPEQMKAGMDSWIEWKDALSEGVKFEFGMLLQAVASITPDQVGESHNPASGYAWIDGDKDNVMNLLQSHPHLKRPGASIDLLEILAMPGIDA